MRNENVALLAQVVLFFLGAHYMYLYILNTDGNIFVPRGLQAMRPHRPPPLHPCVRCEIEKAAFDAASDPPPSNRWADLDNRRHLPLSFCGYGASNFSWINYPGAGDNECMEQGGRLRQRFFPGLGYDEVQKYTKIPSKEAVRRRVKELRKIWNVTEASEDELQRVVWGTGLSKEQLEEIELNLVKMEREMDKWRDDNESGMKAWIYEELHQLSRSGVATFG
jgi:hypothetical protein